MKKKIDKLRAIEFRAVTQNANGEVYGHIMYDARKLRRITTDDLREIVAEKTLQIYPFAILGGWVHRYSDGVVEYPVRLPLSPALKVTKEEG